MSLFDARFYELLVHVQDSLDRFAANAKRYGYSGIAVINSDTGWTDNVPEGFSVYSAIEVSGKPSKLRDEVKRYKERGDILIARGGDEEFNRAAAETAGLDILLQPTKFNHVIAKAAHDNSVAIGFNIGSIIHLRGEARIREIRVMRANLIYARKYELAVVLTGDAHSIYDLRAPREMAALAGIFGMTAEESIEAMSRVPLEILGRKSPGYVQEGIEVV